jgi:hypothetical protein
VLDLALVLGSIEVAERSRDQTILTDAPLLETADSNPLPFAAGAVGGVIEGLSENHSAPVLEQIVHVEVEVRKVGHGRLRGTGNRDPAHGRRACIDGQRTAWRKECGDRGRIAAAPGCSVSTGELPQLDRSDLCHAILHRRARAARMFVTRRPRAERPAGGGPLAPSRAWLTLAFEACMHRTYAMTG